VFSLGLVLYAVCPAVVAHLAFSFPSGRLAADLDRLLVVSGYVITAGVLGLGTAMTFNPRSSGCTGCPRNLWLVRDDPALSLGVDRLGIWLGLAWSIAVVLVLGWRLLASSAARRRAWGLVGGMALVDLMVVAASSGHSLGRGFLGSDSVDGQLWLAQAAALVLLAAAVPAGLVQARHSYRALARLVVDLGNATHPGKLREAIGSRLGDPDLVIAYPVDGGRRYVDAEAREVDVAALASSRASTRLTYGGSEVAVVVHRRGVLDTPESVGELASAIHLGLENERLHAEGLSQLADLRSSGGRIVAAGDEERIRLERDLHDGAQQRLIGIALALRLLRTRATTAEPGLAAAEAEVQAAVNELRLLARGLYPAVLRESGLEAALFALAERRLVRIREIPTRRFPAAIEATAYLLVVRASAGSPVTVSVQNLGTELRMLVAVDGDAPDLTDVRDRTTALDGTLTSSSTECGEEVVLSLPVEPQNPTMV
jgi:signal transduction histidine kinase